MTIEIDVGDVIYHKPTGETWVVAYVQGDRLAWIGWPPGEVSIYDCELKEKCTPEKRFGILTQLANVSEDDPRGSYAKWRLNKENGIGGMKEITDSERVSYLLKNGYLPKDWEGLITYLLTKEINATILLDYCFIETLGPSYWRKPVSAEDGTWTEKTHTNGLVFVRNCDRDRIDLILRENNNVN